MKLYHGTSVWAAQQALKQGLQPRRKKKGNWDHTVKSSPDSVYLTTAYPVYFAINAISNERMVQKERGKLDGPDCAIVEIETERLTLGGYYLTPDEDTLEQVGRDSDDIPGDMQARTEWYRDHLMVHHGTKNWATGLQAMGVCAHTGPINVDAITRVFWFEPAKAPIFSAHAMDPSISVMNYQVVGHRYQAMLAVLTGLTNDEIRDQLIEAYGVEKMATLPIDYDLLTHYREELAESLTVEEVS